MLLSLDGPGPRRATTGESSERLLIMGKYRVVGVRPSDVFGGGNVGVP
jgi:hypothetical protein